MTGGELLGVAAVGLALLGVAMRFEYLVVAEIDAPGPPHFYLVLPAAYVTDLAGFTIGGVTALCVSCATAALVVGVCVHQMVRVGRAWRTRREELRLDMALRCCVDYAREHDEP